MGDGTPKIVSSNEAHMACLLLVDTSSSMYGEAILSLNEGLRKFKEDVCKDEQAKKILDIAIVRFSSDVEVVQDWVPIQYMEPVTLIANGGTNMRDGLRVAIDMVKDRSHFYIYETGTTPYKPWIVIITDGQASNMDDMAEEIAELDSKGKLHLWSLAVEGANTALLNKLCGGKRALKLAGTDFSEFFNWLTMSMRSVSESNPGEKPKGVNLPESVDKNIDNDWM